MSETVKLIIEIPKKEYEAFKELIAINMGGRCSGKGIIQTCLNAVKNGIPLDENKGEWIKIQSGDKDFPESIVCSKCRNENSHFDFNEHAEPIGKVFVTSKFCPNCGADMRGGK